MRRIVAAASACGAVWGLWVGPALAAPPWERGVPPPAVEGAHLSIGATGPSTRWYFAEGHTGPSFDEFLLLNNGTDLPSRVDVVILGTSVVTSLTVPAHARGSLNVKDFLPEGDGGLAVTSSQPIVAERVQYFDYHGLTGASSTIGVTETATSWTFAEGYTGPGFSTFILVSNPDAVAVAATVTFQRETGGPVDVRLQVPALGRVSVNAADHVPGSGFTTRVKADAGVVAERAMYFAYGPDTTGGHVAMGARRPALRWDFAEGYTAGFDTYYLLGNPTTETAAVALTFRTGGGATRTTNVGVAPGARLTVRANDLVPGGEAGATLVSTNGIQVVAERAMYFAFRRWNGGTATLGASSLSLTWHFGEGYTSPTFETWLLVANPSQGAVVGQIALRKPDGSGTNVGLSINPNARATVKVNDVPGFGATEFAALVTAATPVVAERVTYFVYPTDFFDIRRLGFRVLSEGMTGPDVFEVKRRMLQMGLDPGGLDDVFTDVTTDAAIAIEKVAGLPRRGIVGPDERAWLAAGRRPAPRKPSGDHLEVDISRQVELYVRDGQVIGFWPTSTGTPGLETVRGDFRVYSKVPGWDCGDLGCLYKPSYFEGGYAVHGYPSVPIFPASHGCTRVPMSMADWVYDALPIGFEVMVYD